MTSTAPPGAAPSCRGSRPSCDSCWSSAVSTGPGASTPPPSSAGTRGRHWAGSIWSCAAPSRHLDEDGVVFAPGLNEELAATAVAGTQLLAELPGHHHDGVVGFWYGKNPGLDRAADAIRHGSYAGTAPLGGAVALIGDDPTAKSSTLPSSSGSMARSLRLPLLSPGSVADVVRLGLHAVALSRYAGLWAGLQIVADVADAAAVVDLGAAWPEIPRSRHDPGGPPPAAGRTGRPRGRGGPLRSPPPQGSRVLPAGVAQRASRSIRPGPGSGSWPPGTPTAPSCGRSRTWVWTTGPAPRSGCASSGSPCPGRSDPPSFAIDPWPRRGAGDRGQGTVLESQLKDALYGCAEMPRVVGKVDPEGRPLVPATGAIDADTVTRALAARLGPDRLPAAAAARLEALTRRPRLVLHVDAPPARTPAFCSGCPHNISTRADDDQLVGLGIGCHIMAGFDAPAGGTRWG